jgi:hypothetical protein
MKTTKISKAPTTLTTDQAVIEAVRSLATFNR